MKDHEMVLVALTFILIGGGFVWIIFQVANGIGVEPVPAGLVNAGGWK